MIDGKKYIETVKLFFQFLESEFGFVLMKETENGSAFYDVEYQDSTRVVSISYENIEDYLQVLLFKLKNGKLPDFDDKTHSLQLQELNRVVLSKIDEKEIEGNKAIFSSLECKEPLERKLLKCARELRLVLNHWDLLENSHGISDV